MLPWSLGGFFLHHFCMSCCFCSLHWDTNINPISKFMSGVSFQVCVWKWCDRYVWHDRLTHIQRDIQVWPKSPLTKVRSEGGPRDGRVEEMKGGKERKNKGVLGLHQALNLQLCLRQQYNERPAQPLKRTDPCWNHHYLPTPATLEFKTAPVYKTSALYNV